MSGLMKRIDRDDIKEEKRVIRGISREQLLEEVKPTTISEMVEQVKKDMVNSPDHYKTGGVETIDFIEAKATKEELRGYLKFNVIKYLSRAKYKGHDLQDLKKAQWYLNRLVSTYGEPNEN